MERLSPKPLRDGGRRGGRGHPSTVYQCHLTSQFPVKKRKKVLFIAKEDRNNRAVFFFHFALAIIIFFFGKRGSADMAKTVFE